MLDFVFFSMTSLCYVSLFKESLNKVPQSDWMYLKNSPSIIDSRIMFMPFMFYSENNYSSILYIKISFIRQDFHFDMFYLKKIMQHNITIFTNMITKRSQFYLFAVTGILEKRRENSSQEFIIFWHIHGTPLTFKNTTVDFCENASNDVFLFSLNILYDCTFPTFRGQIFDSNLVFCRFFTSLHSSLPKKY